MHDTNLPEDDLFPWSRARCDFRLFPVQVPLASAHWDHFVSRRHQDGRVARYAAVLSERHCQRAV